MVDPSFADTLGTWVAPTVALIVAAGVTAVASAVIGRARDKRKAENQAVEDAKIERENLAAALADQVAGLVEQVQEMHEAMLGEKPTPWNPHPRPGVVARVENIEQRVENVEDTLFTNGGTKNTIRDQLGRIEGQGGAGGSETHP